MTGHQARCPSCDRILNYDGSLVGTTGACPDCGAEFVYPQPAFAERGAPGEEPPQPEEPVAPTCPNCGAAAPPGSGAVCPFCGTSFAGALGTIPWEEREHIGFLNAFFQTIRQVIVAPTEFFDRMPVTGGLASSLLFSVILGTSVGWVTLGAQFMVQQVMWGITGGGRPGAMAMGATFYLVLALLMPVIAVVGMFVGSAILHVCLMLVGGANRDFEATFRVCCYASVPSIGNVLGAIPFFGGIAGLGIAAWIIVLEVFGFMRAHKTTAGKAVLAALMPVMAACLCGVILGAVIIGYVASQAH